MSQNFYCALGEALAKKGVDYSRNRERLATGLVSAIQVASELDIIRGIDDNPIKGFLKAEPVKLKDRIMFDPTCEGYIREEEQGKYMIIADAFDKGFVEKKMYSE